MMFITKLKKADSTEDKTYRPISLSSYYGWWTEEFPLNWNQHAYRMGKFTDITIHNVTTSIENIRILP
jgi:hypothetical protein